MRGRRGARALLLGAGLAAGVAGLAPAARAQAAATGAVQGVVVVGGTDVGLPYAAVSLGDATRARFVSLAGRFAYPAAPAGAHVLRVRRIGFHPVDTTVVVTPGATTTVRIELRRLPQELAAVRVTAAGPCRTPGPPSTAEPELAEVFAQLRLNAEQYALLVETYPFVYTVARSRGDRRGGRERIASVDTVVMSPAPPERYAPGRVVRADERDARARRFVLPTLLDLAEPAFQATHCFFAGGLDTLDGRRVVRVDFRADARLRTPDVQGAFYLDARTYQLVAADLALTAVPDGMPGVERVEARTRFHEVVPGVPVIAEVDATTRLVPARRRVAGEPTERLSLVAVEFAGPQPPTSTPPPASHPPTSPP